MSVCLLFERERLYVSLCVRAFERESGCLFVGVCVCVCACECVCACVCIFLKEGRESVWVTFQEEVF